MSYVDFGEIKAKVGIADALQMLGIDNQRFKQTARDQLRGCCPIHNGDNPRGFVITPSKGLWHCFASCGGGDVIALVAKIKHIDPKAAALFLAEGSGLPPDRRSAAPKRSPGSAGEPLRPLDYLQPDHPSIEALGVTAETAAAWESGYAPKGIMRGRYAVPLKAVDGTLVAYVGIAVSEEQSPRLHFPNGFDPQTVIFGADRITEGPLTLVRDPLQAIVASQSGVENVVAFLTPTIVPQQLEQLASLIDEKGCESVEMF